MKSEHVDPAATSGHTASSPLLPVLLGQGVEEVALDAHISAQPGQPVRFSCATQFADVGADVAELNSTLGMV